MKILFIDYLSYVAHKNFNKIQVDALQKLGCQIDFVGNKNQFDNIYDNGKISITEIIGGFATKKHKSPLLSRIANILYLSRVKYRSPIKEYDIIIFPTYDILSLFFFRTKKKTILINHNNVSQLWSKIKLWMTRHLSDNYIHIALSEEMKEELQKLIPLGKCYYIPHGIIEPTNNFKRPLFVQEGASFIFCPVNRNFDEEIVNKLLVSDKVNSYLKINNLYIIIKKITEKVKDTDYIRVINGILEKAEYDYLIKYSQAVLLPYKSSFKYRCSGIMFESISYNTPIIATDIPALKCFENDCNINYFIDEKSFLDTLKEIRNYKQKKVDRDKFNPYNYWEQLFSREGLLK